MPNPVIGDLNREINATLSSREMEERQETHGVRAAGGPPEAFGALIRQKIERHGQLIRTAGIQVE